MTTLLPENIMLIATFLPTQDARNLSLVSQSWRAATEPHLWSSIAVQHWDQLRLLLSIRPDLARYVRKVAALPSESPAVDRLTVTGIFAPYLLEWKEIRCGDPSDDVCATAQHAQLSLVSQPMPRLSRLALHLDATWPLTLPHLLRAFPTLASLWVDEHAVNTIDPAPPVLWPRMALTTATFRLASTDLVQAIASCCPLRTVHMELAPIYTFTGSLPMDPIARSTTVRDVVLQFAAAGKTWWEFMEVCKPAIRWTSLSVVTRVSRAD